MSKDPLSNPIIEAATLAAILRDNGLLNGPMSRLEPKHFTNDEYRAHFEAMLDLNWENRPINLVTLKAELGTDPLGGESIASRLSAVSFDGAEPSPRDMVYTLRDLSYRREMKAFVDQAGEALLNMATKPSAVATMLISESDRMLASARPARQTFWLPPDGMNEALRRIQDGDDTVRIATGLTRLDQEYGGLHRKQTTILAARTSTGKSTVVSAIATNVAESGLGVLYLSLEMTLEQLEARRASAATYAMQGFAPIPYSRALNKQLSDDELERFMRAGASVNLLPITIEEKTPLSTIEIAGRIRRARQEFAQKGQELALCIVDHLGKVKASDPRAQRVYQLGQISEDLSAIAKSENVAMLLVHQLNRRSEDSEDKRPELRDLRESGRLEEDADAVWLLFRASRYLAFPKDGESAADAVKRRQLYRDKINDLELIVGKTRNGAIGTVNLFCDMPCNIVRDKDAA